MTTEETTTKETTVRAEATIHVAGLKRGEVGRLPREQAIALAQGGWVRILEEEPTDGVQGLRTSGVGDGGQPDLAGAALESLGDEGGADHPDEWPDAGGSGVGNG